MLHKNVMFLSLFHLCCIINVFDFILLYIFFWNKNESLNYLILNFHKIFLFEFRICDFLCWEYYLCNYTKCWFSSYSLVLFINFIKNIKFQVFSCTPHHKHSWSYFFYYLLWFDDLYFLYSLFSFQRKQMYVFFL